MDVTDQNQLMKDYVKRFQNVFRILEPSGFCRFIIRNGRVVERRVGATLYSICILISADACAAYLMWFANLKEQYLSSVDFMAIIYFTIFANLLMFNITFGDKYRGLNIILKSIEIDALLGAAETEFMRKILIKLYIMMLIMIGATQVAVVAYMYYIFHVSIGIHVVGSIYFLWLFYAYDDYGFFIYSYLFLTARVRYLNVALMKMTKFKMEYIPKPVLFHILLWKDEFDDRVTFHNRSDTKNFLIVFRILFHQLRRIENCYSFPIILGVVTVATGSMVSVQTFILYIKTLETMLIRATAILGWSITSWFHLLIISLQADLFYEQIEQTKLICAYIQLKPNTSEEILKLTKNIFKSLEIRDARVSVYGMFSYDTSLVLKIAASTFVYVTVQLQLAFPNLKEVHKEENVTSVQPAFDFDPIKVKELWFF